MCAKTNEYTTFGELRTSTICVAKNLRRLGFKCGQVIAIVTDNTAEIAPLVFAAICLGCQIAALKTCFTKSEYEYFLTFLKPNYIFCDWKSQAILKKCMINCSNDVQFFIFDRHMNNGAYSVDRLFQIYDDEPDFV